MLRVWYFRAVSVDADGMIRLITNRVPRNNTTMLLIRFSNIMAVGNEDFRLLDFENCVHVAGKFIDFFQFLRLDKCSLEFRDLKAFRLRIEGLPVFLRRVVPGWHFILLLLFFVRWCCVRVLVLSFVIFEIHLEPIAIIQRLGVSSEASNPRLVPLRVLS